MSSRLGLHGLRHGASGWDYNVLRFERAIQLASKQKRRPTSILYLKLGAGESGGRNARKCDPGARRCRPGRTFGLGTNVRSGLRTEDRGQLAAGLAPALMQLRIREKAPPLTEIRNVEIRMKNE